MTAALAAALAPAAMAKVDGFSTSGFAVSYEADVPGKAADAYAKFLNVSQWWNATAHSFSGDAANLSIDASAGGCWCEKLADGGVIVHMTATHVMPNQMLVFTGGLGPLGFMGVAGSMTVAFEERGESTHVTMRYAVGGYDPDGFKDLPGKVDEVLNEGFTRYTAFASK